MWGGVYNVGNAINGNTGCTIYPIAQEFMSPPVVGRKTFSIDKSHWNGDWDDSAKQMGLQ